MGLRPFTPGRSGIIAKAAAPTASNASRAAMSRYLPVESRLPVMAASHPDTSAPPTRGRRSTRSPAAISTRPTRRMNVRPSTGRRRSTSGLRYLSQSTKRLVNLSAPATMGTSPYPIRNSVLASDGMLAPPTGRLRRRGGPGSPRGRLLLQVGEVAPHFELLDEEGKPTRLSSFRGRNVVIVFFPAAFSPICTQELKQIGARRMEYERENAAVIGISVDNRWSLRAFKRDEGLSATLLSAFHPKGNVAQKFGVFLGETGYAKRGNFVVDKDGVIRGISVKEPKEPRNEEDYFNLLRNCPR